MARIIEKQNLEEKSVHHIFVLKHLLMQGNSGLERQLWIGDLGQKF